MTKRDISDYIEFVFPQEGVVDISLPDLTHIRSHRGRRVRVRDFTAPDFKIEDFKIDPITMRDHAAIGDDSGAGSGITGTVLRAWLEFEPDGPVHVRLMELEPDQKTVEGPKAEPVEPPIDDLIRELPDEIRHETIKEMAKDDARAAASDAVAEALAARPDLTLADLQALGGIEPAEISRIKRGRYADGPSLWKLAQIALLLDKRLKISFE